MKQVPKPHHGNLMIAGAGACWGTLGSFAQILLNQGFSAEMVSLFRLTVGCLVLILIVLFTNPKLLKIDKRGLLLTATIGLVSQAGFNLLYFNAIRHIGIAMSAVLLYTAPIFMLLWSILFFGERLTGRKLLGISICFIGCTIAVTGGNLDIFKLSALGLLLGVLSAVSYSLMSAISKHAMADYAPITIVIYSFLFGSLFLLPFNMSITSFDGHLNWVSLLAIIGLGLIPSALSYRLYTAGIAKGVDLSVAGVLSTLELVISVLLAWRFFHEPMGLMHGLGIGLILISILLMNWNLIRRVFRLNAATS